jgi:hypothetical protein
MAEALALLAQQHQDAVRQARQEYGIRIHELLDELCRRECEEACVRMFEERISPLQKEVERRRRRHLHRTASLLLSPENQRR